MAALRLKTGFTVSTYQILRLPRHSNYLDHLICGMFSVLPPAKQQKKSGSIQREDLKFKHFSRITVRLSFIFQGLQIRVHTGMDGCIKFKNFSWTFSHEELSESVCTCNLFKYERRV